MLSNEAVNFFIISIFLLNYQCQGNQHIRNKICGAAVSLGGKVKEMEENQL
jgi:hypothetical protein